MLFDISLETIWQHLFQLGIAFALALPIAINREHRSDGAGLRTFPLVTIASCAFMLVGMSVYEGSMKGLTQRQESYTALSLAWGLSAVVLLSKPTLVPQEPLQQRVFGLRGPLAYRWPTNVTKLVSFCLWSVF